MERDAWLNSPEMKKLIAEIDAYGAVPDERLKASNRADTGYPANLLSPYNELSALFFGHNEALDFMSAWLAPMLRALRAAPLGHAAFRHMHTQDYTVLQLIRSGRAELSLVLVARGQSSAMREQRQLSFTDTERYERVVGGEATVRLVERLGPSNGPAHFSYQPLQAVTGTQISQLGPRQALIIDRVESYFLRLRLTRRPLRPKPARNFLMGTGELIHQSAGAHHESHQELAMAVLGAMKHKPAVPAITAIADSEASNQLRWEAVRQSIALDSAAGFLALSKIADTTDDPLSEPARRLRAQLITTYPQLERLLCPA